MSRCSLPGGMCCLSCFVTLIARVVLPDPFFTPLQSLSPLILVRRSFPHHPIDSVLHDAVSSVGLVAGSRHLLPADVSFCISALILSCACCASLGVYRSKHTLQLVVRCVSCRLSLFVPDAANLTVDGILRIFCSCLRRCCV